MFFIMKDLLTKRKRSWNMAQIKCSDTKPERWLRSSLHRAGYRFIINGPKNRGLPGKPDIVLPKHRTVIFVNGCFWHQHKGCREGRKPLSNQEYWNRKLDRNVARDIANRREAGWKVVVFWECEIEKGIKNGKMESLIAVRLEKL